MKINIKPRRTVVITSPVKVPEPPEPHLPTDGENEATTKFIEQISTARGKPTAEEDAAISKRVEQIKAGG